MTKKAEDMKNAPLLREDAVRYHNPTLDTITSRLDALADEIVGKDILVICSRPPSKDGKELSGRYYSSSYAHKPAIVFAPGVCYDLLFFSEDTSVPDRLRLMKMDTEHTLTTDVTFDLLTVGHEFGHAEGTRNEGQANCRGIGLFAQVASALAINTTISDIDLLAYSQSLDQGAEYHSNGC
jgi:hypothetical protein